MIFLVLILTTIFCTGILGERNEELWEWDPEDGGEPGEGNAAPEQHAGPHGERPSPPPADPA